MAQFLDYDWDSDEDFEETSQQGREGLFSSLDEKFISIIKFLESRFPRFSFWCGKMSFHDGDVIFVYQVVRYIIIRRRGEICWPRGWQRSRAGGRRGWGARRIFPSCGTQ